MKTIKYIYTLFVAVAALMVTGCVDRLDIPKHGSLGGPENYYQTDEETMAAVSSMYNTWRGQYYNWYMTLNSLSDDIWTGGGSRGDNSEMEKLNEYTFDSSLGMISSLYSGLYSTIYKANLILDNVSGTTETMKRAIAEAKVVRAWCHFNLVSLWGTAPALDHVLEVSEYHQSNGTPEATYAFVEQDLTEAIESGMLPSKNSVNDQETGMRLTVEAAKSFLGKVYLFEGKYSNAASVLDEVIDSHLYDLYADYENLLHAVANNCEESIFEFQVRNDPEQMWNQMSFLGIMQGWRFGLLSVTPEAAQVFALGTYGFFNPRGTLYDAFVEMEGADGYRLNCTMRTYEQVKEAGVSLLNGAQLPGHESYFMWKNRSIKADLIMDNPGFQIGQYYNYRVMRYAEVLLMAAEAHVQGNIDQSKALNYINQVRERAQLSPLSSVTLDDIKKEKRLELCLETVRYQDLVRWGDAETVLKDQGKEVPAFSSVLQADKETYKVGVTWPYYNNEYGFKAKHKLLPIPLKELEVNSSMNQNEGW